MNHIPKEFILDYLKNTTGHKKLTRQFDKNKMIGIYFYEGHYTNAELIIEHTKNTLKYTSKITIPQELLITYSQTYNVLLARDKILETLWFVNIPCTNNVAECIKKVIINE